MVRSMLRRGMPDVTRVVTRVVTQGHANTPRGVPEG